MKKLIIANWKCNPATLAEAKKLFLNTSKKAGLAKNAEVVVLTPAAFLGFLSGAGENSKIKLGAQNCYFEEKGAFTGELSAKMLKSVGCKYVLVGHSERRKIFKETDQEINKKLKAILSAGIAAILCVGETQEQRNNGETEKILEEQIKSALLNVSCFMLQVPGICIAYEPVWAIGTQNPCDPEEAEKMKLFIKKIIFEIYGTKIAENLKILYGGSVNSKNFSDYLTESKFDGLLIGGASLNPADFGAILKSL